MLIKKPADIRPSEITSQSNYLNRRAFMQAAAATGTTLAAGSALPAVIPGERRAALDGVVPSDFSTDETPNSYMDVTTYNNFYEFGARKQDPHRNSQDFEAQPWTVEVSGIHGLNRPTLSTELLRAESAGGGALPAAESAVASWG